MIIHVAPNATKAANESALLLSKEFLQTRVPILFLTSGGSALHILDTIDTSLLSPRFTIGILDERFNEQLKDASSNLYAFSKTIFFKAAQLAKTHILTSFLAGSLQQQTNELEKSLRDWKKNHSTGVVIITQGIGPDGHTAGIMPYPADAKKFANLFDNPKHWVAGYDAGTKNEYPQRITVTLPFLRSVDLSVVYACTDQKRDALAKTLALDGKLSDVPARVLGHMKRVELFTDINI